ncbi:ribbon-helix-helix domain-containing protein [Bacterioplanoides pacificum]|uniref:Ribbon-helix-helix domain-containing protein n=1 Tax=Bacterioplanoides pacificum TaxID=1171596 RepID=A0ABV7VNB7_9GAMM
MCQLFINADSHLWSSKTRSLRIDGVVTSIRLEHYFWHTLQEIAQRDQVSLNQLITRLYLESLDADHDAGNFTSFLRVCCARYLSLAADGYLQRNDTTPLAGINASEILSHEAAQARQRQVRWPN